MLAKRIIPCLDIKDGRTVKGVNFNDLYDAGDPVELATRYADEQADELVFLDITATEDKRKTLYALVKEIAKCINIPFTIGGGIKDLADAYRLLDAGADKISLNTAAFNSPALIDEMAAAFGNQFVVIAIDSKQTGEGDFVHTMGGKIKTDMPTQRWAAEVADRGAGEILLTSMDADGTRKGFDIKLLKKINTGLFIPLIASGGAGNQDDFLTLFESGAADAALAASVFHHRSVKMQNLKTYLSDHGVPVRMPHMS